MKSAVAQSFPARELSELEAYLAQLNEQHRDVLLLLARFRAGLACAERSELLFLDPAGLLLRVAEVGQEPLTVELPFAVEATSLRAMQSEFMKLVFAARTAAGIAVPITRFESQLARSAALQVQRARVRSRTVLSPRVFALSIEVEGGAFSSPGFDASVFLYAPTTDQAQRLLEDGFTMADYRAMGEDDRPAGAYLTVRSVRGNVMELWCVRHSTPRQGGLAVTDWAWQARPDAPLAFWGPRTAFEPPPGTERCLLVADESALAAAFGVIESLPASMEIGLLAECAGPSERLPVPAHPRLSVQWCYRDGLTPGRSGALQAGASTLRCDPSNLYVFGGGEATEMIGLGQTLQQQGFESAQIQLSGFWRHDQRNGVHASLTPRQ